MWSHSKLAPIHEPAFACQSSQDRRGYLPAFANWTKQGPPSRPNPDWPVKKLTPWRFRVSLKRRSELGNWLIIVFAIKPAAIGTQFAPHHGDRRLAAENHTWSCVQHLHLRTRPEQGNWTLPKTTTSLTHGIFNSNVRVITQNTEFNWTRSDGNAKTLKPTAHRSTLVRAGSGLLPPRPAIRRWCETVAMGFRSSVMQKRLD